MPGKLLEYSTSDLLNKFGMGKHKPGSGSAAALQGLLSAQLIRTVISLSTDDKRKVRYKEWQDEFKKVDIEIEKEIYPALEKIFQEDSEQFDKAIKERTKRDNEPDPIIKRQYDVRAQVELKPATQMPIDIANYCIRLAKGASLIFKNGFKAVRGDSGVALNNAIAAVAGCLSIIDLNLLSIPSDDDTEEMRAQANDIRKQYEQLLIDAKECAKTLRVEAELKDGYYKDIQKLFSYKKLNQSLSYEDIEKLARQVQNTLWKHRQSIWKKNPPNTELDILSPARVFPVLGFHLESRTTLGVHDTASGSFEIAGIIDNNNKHVMISEKFDPAYRNFTTAHELGHALLHDQAVLHRDRPLDGAFSGKGRNRQELEADKFAAYFLMPSTQVIRVFKEKFWMDKFVIADDTVFALNQKSISEFRKKCRDLRGLSMFLSSVQLFGGNSTKSLMEVFNVSQGAMAIRLEELNLIEY